MATFSNAFPTFYMYLDTEDTELIEWYKTRIEKHNYEVQHDPCPNSGFDLAAPMDIDAKGGTIESVSLDTMIKCKMVHGSKDQCIGFYTYPRSSISKTPLMLANHVGIIDSGYRGHLIGKFRNLGTSDYQLTKLERYLQVCMATLEPFLVCMVDSEEALGETSRGTGGFGSTGK